MLSFSITTSPPPTRLAPPLSQLPPQRGVFSKHFSLMQNIFALQYGESSLHNAVKDLAIIANFGLFSVPMSFFPNIILVLSAHRILTSDHAICHYHCCYHLRRKLHPTPKKLYTNTFLIVPSFSYAASASQPVFAPSTEAPMDIFDASTSDSVVDHTTAEVDHWLGAGASDDIASMCVDAALTPEDDTTPSSVEETYHPDGKDVNVGDTEMAPVANVNPFPPLNPYPEFTFPPAPSFPTSLPPCGPATTCPLPANLSTDFLDDEPDYNAPAEDEDPDIFPASDAGDMSPAGDDSASSEQGAHQPSGRISTATWETLCAGFQKLDDLIDKLSHETGHTSDNIIGLWNGDGLMTQWRTVRHVGRVSREILDAHDEMLTVSRAQLTINNCTRKFNTLMRKYKSLAKNASAKDGFESLLVVVGNSIHKDMGLTDLYISPGADKFLEDRLCFDESTMTGLFRNHVCNCVSVDLQERLEKDRHSPSDSSSSSTNVRKGDKDKVDENSIPAAKTVIKAGIRKVLEPFSLGISLEEIPWAKLGGSLTCAGIRIENWPRGVPFPSAPPPKRDVAPGATVVKRKRLTSQGIKDLGHRGIRLFTESFGSDATKIHVVTAKSESLLASKIPLFVEAPPGPGSLNVICRAFYNGHKDFLTPGDRDYKAISGLHVEREIIEITSSPPAETSAAPRRTHSKVKKENPPDTSLLQPSKKRVPKKSKEMITDSEEISDEDYDHEHLEKKGKLKATATATKGKGKDKMAPIDIDAPPVIPPNKSSRKFAPTPIATEANLGPPTDKPKVVFKPISSFIAAMQAVAAAAKANTATNAGGVAMASAITAVAKPTPRPVKKPMVPIFDPGDPFLIMGDSFLVKPAVSTNEGLLQGPAQPRHAKAQTPQHTEATAPPIITDSTTTMATHKKPSAFGPPRHPSTAPSSSSNASKCAGDAEKVTNIITAKRFCGALKSPSPEGAMGVQAMQDSSSCERMAVEEPAASSAAQPAANTSAQGYQWPYGPYYPPFGFPPAPGWNYPLWNQDRPAGSAGDPAPAFPFPAHPMMAGDSVPPFPFPTHPMMPFPPFYPGTAANSASVPAKPAEGEPGPSRST
ncbi:uncharacterized protein LACBIDRAFT_331573 [Laccaria bicolor S238N-H82]|uniref:Predicted protein n=1 Tax=Laccaria bicolor (strain S238N-H82 / ATCC MYA-4686) TaxID=486041 RepID=B0DPV7_LACBS|nr:uncharacterized protein LACBIDRAFT_331573 [Laccaria bicolor S238N-H82]EDR03521.1 predicted protein [Laccaria bicolor S238N-H82]|eukprot:XP_001885977.1 predicted protein [Laccaria bicolor S238N-H82]